MTASPRPSRKSAVPAHELRRRCEVVRQCDLIPVILPDGTVTGRKPSEGDLLFPPRNADTDAAERSKWEDTGP